MSKPVSLTIALQLLIVVLIGQPLLAQPPAVLRNAPSDYHLVVLAKSVESLNQKATRIARDMNVEQPPDVATLLADGLGLNLAQLDRARPMVLLLPRLAVEQDQSLRGALLLPVRDFEAFATDNKAQADGQQRVIVNRQGDKMVLRQLDNYALVADTAEIAEQVAKPNRPVTEVLAEEESALLDASDIWLRVNAAQAWATLRPIIEHHLQGGPGQADGRLIAELIALLAQDVETANVGVIGVEAGIELRGLLRARENTDLARAIATVERPKQPLIVNVPMDNYMVLLGAGRGIDPQSALVGRMADIVKKGLAQEIRDAELANRLVDQRLALARLVSRVSMSATSAAPGENGQPRPPVVLTTVAEVTDAEQARKLARQHMADIARIRTTNVEATGPMWTYQESAEQVADVPVDRLSGRPGALMPDMGPFADAIARLLGEQQITIRVAVYRDRLVSTVGGGIAAMERAFKAIDAETTLKGVPGIPQVQPHVMQNPNLVAYLALDRVASLALGLFAGMANIEVPAFGRVEQPVAISAAATGRNVECRMFVPTQLLRAGADFVRQMRQPGPAPAEAAPTR